MAKKANKKIAKADNCKNCQDKTSLKCNDNMNASNNNSRMEENANANENNLM